MSRIKTAKYYRKAAKELGIKNPRKYARRMVNKQFNKFLPHGLVYRYEQALRRGNRAIIARLSPLREDSCS
jgi:hypothetical protein